MTTYDPPIALDELVNHPIDDEEPSLVGWVVVARDPYRVRYFDKDAQAMDETNWDAMIERLAVETDSAADDGIDDLDDIVTGGAGWGVADGRDLPYTREYLPSSGSYLIADTGHHDAWKAWQDIAKDLANYPLLNEDAYSEREWNAWREWWGSDGIRDLIGDSADEIANALLTRGATYEGWGTVTDSVGRVYALDLGDAIDDMADSTRLELAYVTHQAMHYWNGFTGEYSKEPAREALLEYIGAVWDVLALLTAGLVETGRYAAGVVPLPFDMGGE